jgi:chorismate dehydratase
VDSVKLFSSSELSQIKEVFTDRGSRTSVALLRVLFLELLGFCPEFRETNPDPQVELQPGQGILVIGDRCFQFDRLVSAKGNDRLQGYDLGELWHTMTGLPFVFAAWASAPGLVEKRGPSGIQELGALLDKARDYGLEHLEELAAASATAGKCGRGGDATSAAISYYFRRSLRYKIGESEWTGMQEFRRLCIKHSIVPSDCELVPV